jgi:hypothetical protein
MNERKPVLVICFEEIRDRSFIEQSGIKVLVIDRLAELLSNETLELLYQ